MANANAAAKRWWPIGLLFTGLRSPPPGRGQKVATLTLIQTWPPFPPPPISIPSSNSTRRFRKSAGSHQMELSNRFANLLLALYNLVWEGGGGGNKGRRLVRLAGVENMNMKGAKRKTIEIVHGPKVSARATRSGVPVPRSRRRSRRGRRRATFLSHSRSRSISSSPLRRSGPLCRAGR